MRHKVLIVSIALVIGIPLVTAGIGQSTLLTSLTQPTTPPTPTPIPVITTDVRSSDGTKKLIMRTKQINTTVTYSFFVADIPDGEEQLLFTKLGLPSSMSLSANSWSPDNQYVFITTSEQASQSAFVFNTSGEPFANGQQYLDVGTVFNENNTGNMLREITGWDSPSLLHLLTTGEKNTKGPAYWFEIPSQALIQLYN